MIKTFCLAALTCATLAAPAFADEAIEYPAVNPNFAFQRSHLSTQAIVIPPYGHVFPIRVFTTPQQGALYNVPPYPVISPY